MVKKRKKSPAKQPQPSPPCEHCKGIQGYDGDGDPIVPFGTKDHHWLHHKCWLLFFHKIGLLKDIK